MCGALGATIIYLTVASTDTLTALTGFSRSVSAVRLNTTVNGMKLDQLTLDFLTTLGQLKASKLQLAALHPQIKYEKGALGDELRADIAAQTARLQQLGESLVVVTNLSKVITNVSG